MAPAVTLRDAAPTSRAMVVAVMVSMVAFLDSTVINLALPAIEHDLGGGLLLQQWIIDGYLLATAAAILPGGSLSDLFGRVPVMRFGLLAFGAGSVLAALAQVWAAAALPRLAFLQPTLRSISSAAISIRSRTSAARYPAVMMPIRFAFHR